MSRFARDIGGSLANAKPRLTLLRPPRRGLKSWCGLLAESEFSHAEFPTNSARWPCAVDEEWVDWVELAVAPGRGPDGAGDGNRTHVSSLGSYSSTIELHPPSVPFYEGRRRGRKLRGEQ